ncbi:flippase [Desulfatiglans anilini]|uniref:flippase n=1 Tax=Desulfatiglans anilini TaxID=90728 RepID=UPI000481FC16|nr:flippase [Desulfatiglans anilini]
MIRFFQTKLQNLISDKKFSQILTGSVWALGARVISTLLAMITTIIIARVYGPEIIGVMAIIASFLSFATIFTIMGTNTSILRLIPEYMAKHSATSAFILYRRIQYLVAGVSVFTGCLLFIFSDLIATRLFSKPHLSFLFALAAIFVGSLSIMNLNTQAVRALQLIRTFAIMQLLPGFSKLLILLALMFIFSNPYLPVYALFGAYFFTALFGAVIMHRAFKRKTAQSDLIVHMPVKEILGISLPMLMTSTLTFMIAQTGVIMLGMFRPETEVGYYDIAVRLATLTTFVLTSINSMAAPKFSELYHTGKMEELFYVAKKSAKLIFWTTLPILLVLVFIGKPILNLFFGPDFTAAYPAMVLLLIAQFVNSISGSTGYFMNMTDNQNVFRNIILGAAIVTVALGFLLIPTFGINGAAFAGMISIVFWNITTIIYIKMKYNNSISYIPFIRIFKTH